MIALYPSALDTNEDYLVVPHYECNWWKDANVKQPYLANYNIAKCLQTHRRHKMPESITEADADAQRRYSLQYTHPSADEAFDSLTAHTTHGGTNCDNCIKLQAVNHHAYNQMQALSEYADAMITASMTSQNLSSRLVAGASEIRGLIATRPDTDSLSRADILAMRPSALIPSGPHSDYNVSLPPAFDKEWSGADTLRTESNERFSIAHNQDPIPDAMPGTHPVRQFRDLNIDSDHESLNNPPSPNDDAPLSDEFADNDLTTQAQPAAVEFLGEAPLHNEFADHVMSDDGLPGFKEFSFRTDMHMPRDNEFGDILQSTILPYLNSAQISLLTIDTRQSLCRPGDR